ncbi:Gfo/Idh/MocA family oxidoreductase [Pedobacter polaris]|uniref:Gfo/Idh/MocA family oxidoreductase n=1 Tax=Pedobacter polaris TaxID=2571273 RepID=A0A4U1CVZ3_9SPHI|nr:Gfo/Idh/MocA family oxidoreductase [Pedobacter polaris]TKC10409.1 Gfo/Idh/MocA family oxidoreductase [Pedobacter polaris]
MERVNWGIIGCGDVTEVKSGPAFNKVPNSKLIAVMRRDANKAKDYAIRHGVPKWFANADELINDPEVNAIYIATPPSSHVEYVLKAIQAKKPVYVEKPMSLNYTEGKRMVDAANANNIKLTVAHYRRAQPMFLKIKSLLDKSAIGDIRLVNLNLLQPQITDIIAQTATNWRIDPSISGGGLFHDLAPHQLDLMIYFFGAIESFYGMSTSVNKSSVDDVVTGQILFKNNVVFNGNWCFNVAAADALDCCEIYGTNGKISFPIFGHKITITQNGQTEIEETEPLTHVQQPMIAKVVDYFLGKADNPCTGETALETMKLIDKFTTK